MKRILILLIMFGCLCVGAEATKNKCKYYIPPYLSKEAKDIIKNAPEKHIFKGDKKSFQDFKVFFDTVCPEAVKELKDSGAEFKIKKEIINTVPCYWITSPQTVDKENILIYTHGGGYIVGSASYLIMMPLQIANAAGMKVLSIDYRLAPEHKFPAPLDDSLNVYKYLLKKGYDPKHIGWFGDSAGGGLALASLLRMNDEKLPLPGALAVISPWADLSGVGDTFHTHAKVDPFLVPMPNMQRWGKAYAGTHNLKEPLISPVYGDYKNFPPMLIQAGTKEVLLSDAVRVAKKARVAGSDVTLDIWDGMWHDFQSLANTPEADNANKEIGEFFKKELNK